MKTLQKIILAIIGFISDVYFEVADFLWVLFNHRACIDGLCITIDAQHKVNQDLSNLVQDAQEVSRKGLSELKSIRKEVDEFYADLENAVKQTKKRKSNKKG